MIIWTFICAVNPHRGTRNERRRRSTGAIVAGNGIALGEGIAVKQLSPGQRELVSSLAQRLGTIRGVRAIVLGGSHARGRAQPGSDIDLGLLYSEADPFAIQSV